MRALLLVAVASFGAAAGFAQGVLVAPGPQPRLAVPAAFFDNSIVCKDPATGTSCQLWLERNGRYRVAFNRGEQKVLPSIDGPWQVEAREGAYVMRSFRGTPQICLTPDSGAGSFEVERAGEPFAGSGCYALSAHVVGDKWTDADPQGRDITYWLVAGR